MKHSPIRLRKVLETIEKIASINNEDETNVVLNDIYRIAHVFAGSCKNPHEDWQKLQEEVAVNLKNY